DMEQFMLEEGRNAGAGVDHGNQVHPEQQARLAMRAVVNMAVEMEQGRAVRHEGIAAEVWKFLEETGLRGGEGFVEGAAPLDHGCHVKGREAAEHRPVLSIEEASGLVAKRVWRAEQGSAVELGKPGGEVLCESLSLLLGR